VGKGAIPTKSAVNQLTLGFGHPGGLGALPAKSAVNPLMACHSRASGNPENKAM
jgi:hypothetical protein